MVRIEVLLGIRINRFNRLLAGSTADLSMRLVRVRVGPGTLDVLSIGDIRRTIRTIPNLSVVVVGVRLRPGSTVKRISIWFQALST